MTADKGAARLRYSFMPHVNGGLQIRRGKDIVGAIEPRPARGLPPYVLLSQGDVVARFASIGAAKRYVLQEWAGIAVGTPSAP
jgi:hypothetical protein